MSEIDPVVLKLIAEAQDYHRSLENAERMTDKRLGAIEKRGFAMGQNLRKGFDLAKTAAVSFVAASGVQVITDLISKGLEHASALGEQAAQLGVTTDALQEYRYAASQAGLSNDEMDQALSQLTRRIGEAANGTKAQAQAFETLGISVKDAEGKVLDAGAAIPLIAEALQKVESPAERAALLMDLFGRAGQKLEPLLADGAKGVNDLRKAAHDLGIVMDRDMIDKADEAADKMSALKQVLDAKLAIAVANNADKILALAERLGTLADKALNAFDAISKLANSPLGKVIGYLNTASGYLNPVGQLMDMADRASSLKLPSAGSGGGRVTPMRPRGNAPVSGSVWQGAVPANQYLRTNFAGMTAMGMSPLDGWEPGRLQGGLDAISSGAQEAREAFANLFQEMSSPAIDDVDAAFDMFVHDTRAMREAAREAADRIDEAFRDAAGQGMASLSNGITDAILGVENLGDVFTNVSKQIISDLIRIAVQKAITDPLGDLLLGGLQSAFGPRIGGNTARLETNFDKVFASRIPAFATGTNFAPGGLSLVGERGPELVNLPRGSQVIPNNRLNTVGGGVSGTITIALTDDLNGRIANVAGPIAVRVVSQAGPTIAQAGSSMARERMTRSGKNTLR